MLKSLILETKKYDIKSFWLIILGFAFVPAILTSAVILWKAEKLQETPLSYFAMNNTGMWSALFYPFFVVLIIQMLVDAEKKTNSLLYYKAYKKHWYELIHRKIILAFVLLLILTAFNLVLNTGVMFLADHYIKDKNAESIIIDVVKDFTVFPLAFIPLLYFHSFLVYSIRNSYVSFAIGLILIIVGIPLVNLGDIYYNVYANGIAAIRDKAPKLFLVSWGLGVSLFSAVASNFVLKR